MDIVAEFPLTQALFTDQLRIFRPTLRLVTALVGELGATMVPVPVWNDQVPIPPVGVIAARLVLGELIQIVWLTPALADVGVPVIAIVTIATLGAQTPPLVTDHCKTFSPISRVTCVVASVGVAIVPLPCAMDQLPVFVKVPKGITFTVLGLGARAEIVVTELLRQSV